MQSSSAQTTTPGSGAQATQPSSGAGSGSAATAAAPGSGSSAIVQAAQENKGKLVAGALIALVILGVAGYGVFSMLRGKAASVPFQNFTITQVTNSGKVLFAAISPDGKYVLSVVEDGGRMSLWLRNIPTGSNTQVLPPENALYQNPAFSPDGNYIYFSKASDAAGNANNLYRIPVLGGEAVQLVRDVDVGPTFSPEGQRMAYLRANDPVVGKYLILSANMDGSDEKIIYTAPTPYPIALAWSPDGKLIAYIQGAGQDAQGGVRTLDIATGQDRALATLADKFANALAWMPDNRGLMVVYTERSAGFNRFQIAFVSFPDGQFHPLTNDTNGYHSVSISADGKSIAAMQRQDTNFIALLPPTGRGNAAQLAGLPTNEQIRDILWDKDGNLLAVLRHSIVRASLDGNHQSTVLTEPNAVIINANACPNGGPILVNWASRDNTGKLNIWRVDADGSHPKQLTNGVDDELPVCAADGKSFFYADLDKKSVLNRMPIAGGTPELIKASAITHGFLATISNNTSPDGRWLPAIVTKVDPATQADLHALALIDVAANTESSMRIFPSQPTITLPLRYTPDWKSVAYRVIDNGTDNIWMQPVDGSAGHPVTEFTSDHIRAFAWSLDGKTLAVARTHTVSDVVLLREGKAAQ